MCECGKGYCDCSYPDCPCGIQCPSVSTDDNDGDEVEWTWGQKPDD